MGKEKIAFIGTGVMGSSIVKHLRNAEYDVTIFTRTKERAESVIALGAKWAETVGQAVKDADLIFTMVGYPADVEEVYYSKNGIFANAQNGAVLVDMTTSSPELAKRIAADGENKGLHSIDAPVSGGDVGAQNGTLSIMCGGDEQTFKRLLPILEVFGKQIVYQGGAGAGQHTKMCNQIAIATNMIGVCEALAYGKAAGLDADTILQSISSGAAGSWSLSNLAPRIINGDFEPGFFVKHFLKDMNIALSEAELMGISLPGLEMARNMYDELIGEGYGEKGTQVLYKRYIGK
ncbi:NAD(P)-dependent oxidoreductase [Sporosarcina thermotolerans]|uniref:NAD(P)-dependent oxidoreductase n=1 Tax=Sporosarcina thermotolerans TaxID=633404 RepID=A0AAW9A500_9BACL|nr:NAD(P)-dependent oxidoreductase [Sporosarcina thermotolerans]MDW0115904.1 NAD(P)-dependent oxidoreductase [Sporosarcina thermotolerans]WHT46876.1 NAD(P)-dependent oxidoreductase [Sporosarcina thermotolerans]